MHNRECEGGQNMNGTILISKSHMECPLCDKIHEIEEQKRTTTTIIKGEHV